MTLFRSCSRLGQLSNAAVAGIDIDIQDGDDFLSNMSVTRQYAAGAVAATLAAECCCSPSDFYSEGVHIFELTPEQAANPLARRFPVLEDSLAVMGMGAGVVVAATVGWMGWVSELFDEVRDADEAFSLSVLSEASRRVEGCSLQLNGPYAYNVTSEQDWVNRSAPDGYVVEVGRAERR